MFALTWCCESMPSSLVSLITGSSPARKPSSKLISFMECQQQRSRDCALPLPTVLWDSKPISFSWEGRKPSGLLLHTTGETTAEIWTQISTTPLTTSRAAAVGFSVSSNVRMLCRRPYIGEEMEACTRFALADVMWSLSSWHKRRRVVMRGSSPVDNRGAIQV